MYNAEESEEEESNVESKLNDKTQQKDDTGDSYPKSPLSSNSKSLSTGRNFLPLAPDGGWGWVIVFACFICNAFVDGMCGVFGVFLPDLLEYYGESPGKTVIAGSVLPGGFLCSGPLASALIHCFGCRIVTMTGGLLSAAAFALCTFSPNVDVLILTYGVMGGVGLGLIYLPAMVMLGFYFERRRALATGIACSGAGFGVLALAPLSAWLLKQYNWQNAMLLIAACVFHSVAMGALMRPLPTSEHPSECSTDSTGTSEENKTEKLEGNQNMYITGSLSTLPEENTSSLPGQEDGVTRPRSATVSYGFKSRGESHHSLHRQAVENLLLHRSKSHSSNKEASLLNSEKSEHVHISESTENSQQPNIHSCVDLPITYSHGVLPKKCSHPHSNWWQAFKRGSTQVPRTPAERDKPSVLSASCYELSSPDNPYKVAPQHCSICSPKDSKSYHMTRPISRMDIIFGGSTLALSKFPSDMQSKLSIISGTSHPKVHSHLCPCASPHLRDQLRVMCDMSMVKNPYFLVICLASIFIQIGYFVPIMFLSTYAKTLGIEREKAAMLLSVIGISNTIGRAAAGGLANIPRVNALHLNNVSLLIAGVFTVLCGLAFKTFLSLVLYAAVFGLFIASFVPLTTVFLVDYLGLDKLTSAYGLLSMVRGIASMTGAPIAGLLMGATASYTATFCFAGSMFIVAGFIYYLLPLVTHLHNMKHENNRERVIEV